MTTTTPNRENLFARWSRLKQEVAAGAVPPGTVAPAAVPPAQLPSLEALAAQGLEADLSAFMQAGVEEGLRRAAVQQLFKQPIFNVMDGLDVYIEDFNLYEPLAAEALPGLAHARDMLFPNQAAAPAAVSEDVVAAPTAVEPTADVAVDAIVEDHA